MKKALRVMMPIIVSVILSLVYESCGIETLSGKFGEIQGNSLNTESQSAATYPKKIALRSASNGKYLRIGGQYGGIYADSPTNRADLSTVWHVADLKDGKFALKGIATGSTGYVYADRDDPCYLQYFPVPSVISNLGNGTVAIFQDPYFGFFSVGSDGSQALTANATTIGPGETFYLEDMTGVYGYSSYLQLPEVVSFGSGH